MPEWQLIDTAPATGSFLVAALHSPGQYSVGEAERDPDRDDDFWWVSQRGEYYASSFMEQGLIPTHWMPLPDPPG
jgi:hypothetical protein